MESSLDIRQISEFAIHNNSQLNNETSDDRENEFKKQLLQALEEAKYVDTPYKGKYMRLLHPQEDSHVYTNIAAKLLIKDQQMTNAAERFYSDNIELADSLRSEVLTNISYTQENHSTEMKMALYIIWQEKLHMQYFSKYILPSYTAVFKLKHGIKDSVLNYNELMEDEELGESAKEDFLYYKGRGEVSSDGYKLITKEGDVVVMVLQNFERIKPIILEGEYIDESIKSEELDFHQIEQVKEFIHQLQICISDGLCPDYTMLQRGNLGFNEDNNLVLLDINGMDTNPTDFEIQKIKDVVKKLKSFINLK